MTVQVGTVNLMLETRGGSRREGGATWYTFFFANSVNLIFFVVLKIIIVK